MGFKPFLLGVSGGSGSGKTYFSRAIQSALGAACCDIIYQDNFYFDQSRNFDFDGGAVNFDHPASIDFAALAESLVQLRDGQSANIPVYDFITHKRKSETLTIRPKPVIIVDGILIFHDPDVRVQFHERVFFDTPEELRFSRRLKRDVEERGRQPEGVQNQFFKQVKPMHDQYVEPSKAFASTHVRDLGDFSLVLADYEERLMGFCKRAQSSLRIGDQTRP